MDNFFYLNLDTNANALLTFLFFISHLELNQLNGFIRRFLKIETSRAELTFLSPWAVMAENYSKFYKKSALLDSLFCLMEIKYKCYANAFFYKLSCSYDPWAGPSEDFHGPGLAD